MAKRGMRVLGLAEAQHADAWAPLAGEPLNFLGLVGLADPLRPSVAAAVAECHSAGIRVVMVTGDYAATAEAIGRHAGLDVGETIIGSEMDRMSDAELSERAGRTGVFARILPDQKLRIVRALQAGGDVVAMTGDGVNDAPALKAADIGIAMGERGTDVARAAADLVLLDDNFAVIVGAIRVGRRIYDNLQKAMGFILAVHIPIAGLALLPLLLGLPIFLVPAHIAFLEMIIDPVCSIVFEVEREESGIMRRPPRSPKAPLFSTRRIVAGVAQGAVALAAVVVVYAVAWTQRLPEESVRTVAFLALVLSVLALVAANRSFGSVLLALTRPNPAFVITSVLVLAALSAAIGIGELRGVFHFGTISAAGLVLAATGGAGALVGLEVVKRATPIARNA